MTAPSPIQPAVGGMRFDVLYEIAATFSLDYNAVCKCAESVLASTSPAQTGEPTHAQLAAGAFIPQVSGFATHPALAAPSDGKWVPLEATEKMLSAGLAACVKAINESLDDEIDTLPIAFRAMVEAAPALESGLVGVTMEQLK